MQCIVGVPSTDCLKHRHHYLEAETERQYEWISDVYRLNVKNVLQ